MKDKNIVLELELTIKNLLTRNLVLFLHESPSNDKKFSFYIDKIRKLLNSKEWKTLEQILDRIFSGKHNAQFLQFFYEQESKFMGEPLVREFLARFLKIATSKEFREYANIRERYQNCLKKSIAKYDKKMVKNILTCYDIEFHKLMDVVDTKEWFEFSDFVYENKTSLIEIFIASTKNL